MPDEDFSIKDDKLTGLLAIADFIGDDIWRTRRKCASGAIPCAKVQGRWESSKSELRADYLRTIKSGKTA